VKKLSNDLSQDLPGGTVTFLFTDIEGSTGLLRKLGEDYMTLLADHHKILRSHFKKWNGREVDTEGDAFFVSFPRATDAAAAVVEAQRALAEHTWPQGVTVRVRMGLHTGEPWTAGEGYVGMAIHRAARIAHVGHGGQVLLSATTTELVIDELPSGVSLLDLGRHRLKDITRPEHIRQLVIQGLLSEYPPLKSLESIEAEKLSIPNNLPVQSTPFIGRKEELADLEKLLGDPGIRLITVIGPGGMGKTRLALALAERQLEISLELSENGGARYPDGAFFVPLDGLDETEQIVPEIASSLKFRVTKSEASGGQIDIPERTPKQQLLDYLSNKRLLLVMDNFEHLLAGAGLLSEIRQRAPMVKVVATSREKLELHGEQLYQLHGMSVPVSGSHITSTKELLEEYSSVQLFFQSAKRAAPSFELQSGETQDLAQICRLVDGMPLAVELSAGWTDMLSLSDITNEIEHGLDLLETSTKDIPARQRSVQAIFEGTWRRLSPVEQSLFSKLCIFRGGFTRKAAKEVAGASIRQLAGLTSKSLLLFNRQTSRYDIHRLLRHFGLGRLADDPLREQAARDKHSAYYLETIAALEDALYSAQYQSVTNDIESDLENIRTALRWAVERQQVEHLGEAIPPLFQYYVWRHYDDLLFKDAQRVVEGLEGLDSLEACLTKARALSRQGRLKSDLEALELLKKSHAILNNTDLASLDTRRDRAFALLRIGSILLQSHNQTNAREMLEESLILYREVGDRWGEAEAIREMAEHALASGNSLEYNRFIEECAAIRAKLGNPLGLVYSLNDRALASLFQGNVEEAIVFVRRSRRIRLELGDSGSIALSAMWLGFTYLFIGCFDEALESYEEAITISEELGALTPKVNSAAYRAFTHIHNGSYDVGYSQASQFFDDYPQHTFGWAEGISHHVLGCSALVNKEYEEALVRSQQAVDCFRGEAALPGWLIACLTLYTIAGLLKEDLRKAQRNLLEAIQIATKMKELMFLAVMLPAAALLVAYRGEVERAIVLLEMANRHPYVANSKWYEDVVGKRIGDMAKGLSPEVVDAARQRGRERDPWETAKEILAELEAEQEEQSAI